MSFRVLLFAALISLSVAQLEVPGRLVGRSSVRSISHFETPKCDGVNGYPICMDCNKILVCLGVLKDEKDCAVDSPDTPYCVNGGCSAEQNVEIGCIPSLMNCTGVGHYPDPKMCHIYHYCEAIDESSTVYECPQNYVFNPATNLCKQQGYGSDCVTVQCDKSKVFSSYGTSKQFYAYCKYNGTVVENISILKCTNTSSFNGTTCVFTCPKEGNFQHPESSRYYQCYLSGGKLIHEVQNCTSGKRFDQALQVCVGPPAMITTPEPTLGTLAIK